MHSRRRLSVEEYRDGILSGNRFVLSRAITLVESNLKSDIQIAQNLIQTIMPYTGKSIRIGVTGVPGVGKSTFIESFGQHIASLNKKLAVLAVDPSSQRTKGSIMGDKTRMEKLVNSPQAFIRPSPTGDTLGGVARKTRETMLLCEAAGYEYILVETVGVGQSEIAVKGMVDFFLLLMLAGAGDELQGIKKGIVEMADAIIINKADGENLQPAKKAQREYQNALHLFRPESSGWYPKVLTCSALTNFKIDKVFDLISEYHQKMSESGFFEQNREQQNLNWMHEMIRDQLVSKFYLDNKIQSAIKNMEQKVGSDQIPVTTAVKELMNLYQKLNLL